MLARFSSCVCWVSIVLAACSDDAIEVDDASGSGASGGATSSPTVGPGGMGTGGMAQGQGGMGQGGLGQGGVGQGGSPSGPGSGGMGGAGAGGPTGCTAEGLALIAEVNAYRVDNGLPAVPASSSLCIVAETHVTDLATNMPNTGPCNLHSWSDQGSWSPCCYTPDHAQAQCMWDKPGELSAYPGNGYEISYGGSSSPQAAVQAWSNSSGHDAVMLNEGIWAGYPWGAMGGAIRDGYAHVWFGTQTDPMD